MRHFFSFLVIGSLFCTLLIADFWNDRGYISRLEPNSSNVSDFDKLDDDCVI